MQPDDDILVKVYLALHMSGALILIFIILSSLFLRNIKRCLVWYNFCVSWTVFGISFTLLTFAGQQYTSTPNRVLCHIQAALIYASPLLAGCTSVALVVYLLLIILSSPINKNYRKSSILMLVAPWLVFTIVLVNVILFGVRSPNKIAISRNGSYYCAASSSPIPRVAAGCAAFLGTAVLILEVVVFILLYRRRAVPGVVSRSMKLTTRVFIFTLFGLTAALIGLLVAIKGDESAAFDLVMAALTLLAAIIFGTQMDLWKGWLDFFQITAFRRSPIADQESGSSYTEQLQKPRDPIEDDLASTVHRNSEVPPPVLPQTDGQNSPNLVQSFWRQFPRTED